MVTSPLDAFGGWIEADWFVPSIVSDPEVAAFELPKLGRQRKQVFHIIDRTLARSKPDKTRLPRRLAGKLAMLLDNAGAIRTVASCRSRLLFEGAPVLFFADIPAARLKPRAAAKLRRDLVGLALRACVLHSHESAATLMIWPVDETSITDFIRAAEPDHKLHPDFDRAQTAPAKSPTAASGQPARRDGAREAKLLQQIALLQAQIDTLSKGQSTLGAMQQLGLDDARLKSMLKLLHPDKHANSEAATEAAQWVNNLRDLLKTK